MAALVLHRSRCCGHRFSITCDGLRLDTKLGLGLGFRTGFRVRTINCYTLLVFGVVVCGWKGLVFTIQIKITSTMKATAAVNLTTFAYNNPHYMGEREI